MKESILEEIPRRVGDRLKFGSLVLGRSLIHSMYFEEDGSLVYAPGRSADELEREWRDDKKLRRREARRQARQEELEVGKRGVLALEGILESIKSRPVRIQELETKIRASVDLVASGSDSITQALVSDDLGVDERTLQNWLKLTGLQWKQLKGNANRKNRNTNR